MKFFSSKSSTEVKGKLPNKEYKTLLPFLRIFPSVLDEGIQPKHVKASFAESGTTPLNFYKMATHCKGLKKVSKQEAADTVNAVESCAQIAYEAGDVSDAQMASKGVPQSTINRDGKALVHKRAVWMNNGNVVQARVLKEANENKNQQRLETNRQMKEPLVEMLKNIDAHKKKLKQQKKYCYCEKKTGEGEFYVKCGGANISRTIDKVKYTLCPFPGGWVHKDCLEKVDELYDDKEDFYCSSCSILKLHYSNV